MHTYLDAFRKFAELDGRTSRADFWGFVAWNGIFGVLATVADGFLFPHYRTGRGPLGLAYMAVLASPAWCAMVRRLHDKAISGWWTMLGLVPAVGQFILFVMLVQAGDKAENPYGLPPGTELDLPPSPERIA